MAEKLCEKIGLNAHSGNWKVFHQMIVELGFSGFLVNAFPNRNIACYNKVLGFEFLLIAQTVKRFL